MNIYICIYIYVSYVFVSVARYILLHVCIYIYIDNVKRIDKTHTHTYISVYIHT